MDNNQNGIDVGDEWRMLVLHSNQPIEEIDAAFETAQKLEEYLSRFDFKRNDRDAIFIMLKQIKIRTQKAFKQLKESQFDI